MGKTLFETTHWEVILVEDQDYFGRCVIELKRPCSSLSEQTTDEALDFQDNVVKRIETTFTGKFGAVMFNWTCLMNDAFKAEVPEPQLHWHVRPRYQKPVTVAGITFFDKEFGHHYTKLRPTLLDAESFERVFEKIRQQF